MGYMCTGLLSFRSWQRLVTNVSVHIVLLTTPPTFLYLRSLTGLPHLVTFQHLQLIIQVYIVQWIIVLLL